MTITYRRVSDEVLVQARRLFEIDGLSLAEIGEMTGHSRQTLHYWVKRQEWQRPEGWIDPHKHQAKEVDRAAKVAFQEAVANGLEQHVSIAHKRSMGRAKASKANRKTAPGKPAGGPAEGSEAESSMASNPAEEAGLTEKSSRRKGAEIVAFPGGKMPPKAEPASIPVLVPPRSREEAAALKTRLATLRGVLTERQLEQLEHHEQLLLDYHHLIGIYLNPQRAVEAQIATMTPEEASQRVVEVQRAALSLLLPSERDTLAGAIKQLTSSLATTIQLKRVVAGIAVRGAAKVKLDGPDEDDEDGAVRSDGLAKLDVSALRQVKHAMEMLTGRRQAANEPPVPPPPGPLDLGGVVHDPVADSGEPEPSPGS